MSRNPVRVKLFFPLPNLPTRTNTKRILRFLLSPLFGPIKLIRVNRRIIMFIPPSSPLLNRSKIPSPILPPPKILNKVMVMIMIIPPTMSPPHSTRRRRRIISFSSITLAIIPSPECVFMIIHSSREGLSRGGVPIPPFCGRNSIFIITPEPFLAHLQPRKTGGGRSSLLLEKLDLFFFFFFFLSFLFAHNPQKKKKKKKKKLAFFSFFKSAIFV